MGGTGVSGEGASVGGKFSTNVSTGYNLKLPARNNSSKGLYLFTETKFVPCTIPFGGCPISSACLTGATIITVPAGNVPLGGGDVSSLCALNY